LKEPGSHGSHHAKLGDRGEARDASHSGSDVATGGGSHAGSHAGSHGGSHAAHHAAIHSKGHGESHGASHGGGHAQGHGGGAHGGSSLPQDLSAREIGILVPLALVCLAIGFYPKPMLESISPSVEKTLAAYPDKVRQYVETGSLVRPAADADSAVAMVSEPAAPRPKN